MFNLCQIEQAIAVELGDESKLMRMVALKPLDKQIIEHKDVNKVVIQLNTVILSLRTEASDLLNSFSEFSGIWNKVKYIFNKNVAVLRNLLNKLLDYIRRLCAQ